MLNGVAAKAMDLLAHGALLHPTQADHEGRHARMHTQNPDCGGPHSGRNFLARLPGCRDLGDEQVLMKSRPKEGTNLPES